MCNLDLVCVAHVVLASGAVCSPGDFKKDLLVVYRFFLPVHPIPRHARVWWVVHTCWGRAGEWEQGCGRLSFLHHHCSVPIWVLAGARLWQRDLSVG